MRRTLCQFLFASFGFYFSGARTNPYLRLSESTKNGKVQLVPENTSGRPIVAYVVAVVRRRGSLNQEKVYAGVYTGKDSLPSGKSIQLAQWETRMMSNAPTPHLFVDYVRMADGTAWGNCVTEQGKEVAARFKNCARSHRVGAVGLWVYHG